MTQGVYPEEGTLTWEKRDLTKVEAGPPQENLSDHEFNYNLKGFPGGSLVKNPPEMEETWVWSLHWEDPLEKEMATHSSTLAGKSLMDRGAFWATVHRVAKDLDLVTKDLVTKQQQWFKITKSWEC